MGVTYSAWKNFGAGSGDMSEIMNDSDGNGSLWKFALTTLAGGVEVQVPYYPGLVAAILKAEIVDPLTLLFQKVLYTSAFLQGVQPVGGRAGRVRDSKELTVDTLRAQLRRAGKPEGQPVPVRVTGVFSPAVLLGSGWWERARAGVDPVGKNDVQRWTYAGFDLWGPSWDFTSNGDIGQDGYFLGQLGETDELNSILVVAVGRRGREVKAGVADRMHKSQTGAYAAMVSGLLCHRSHLKGQLSEVATQWQGDFNYCLLLELPEHRITPLDEVPDYYSAYLWQCWWAKDQVPAGATPKLNDCYILWEHTDLTKPDAIKYNLDSLAHKGDFIRKEYGNIELLQKSGPLVPGAPGLPSEEFQRLLGAVGRV